MRFIYIGDIVGKTGRRIVTERTAYLRRELDLDFVIVNGENAAHGFGITAKICESLFDAGADVIVTGNHVWDQREILSFIDSEPRLIRPLNFPEGTPGRGAGVFELSDGRRILIAQAQGRLFMDPLDDPYRGIDAIVSEHPLGARVQAALVDFHAEATSEKQALGFFLDGRVSALVGTHTHVPTGDERLLPAGTAYVTDVGMTGPYESVIGMRTEKVLHRFLHQTPSGFEVAKRDVRLAAVDIDIDETTGRARGIERLLLSDAQH